MTRIRVEVLDEGERNTPSVAVFKKTLRGEFGAATLMPAARLSVELEIDEHTDLVIRELVAPIRSVTTMRIAKQTE